MARQLVTQAEFARMEGKARSYITALKKSSRLVMVEGKVDVMASRARIAETSDPNRDDVAARHAAARNINEPVHEIEDSDAVPESAGSHDYHRARAKKEYYLAEQARIEFERQIGKVVERADVEVAIEDVMTVVRQSLEQQPHRMAPMLIGQDLDAIRAIIRQENHGALAEMVKAFQQRIRLMAGEDE